MKKNKGNFLNYSTKNIGEAEKGKEKEIEMNLCMSEHA